MWWVRRVCVCVCECWWSGWGRVWVCMWVWVCLRMPAEDVGESVEVSLCVVLPAVELVEDVPVASVCVYICVWLWVRDFYFPPRGAGEPKHTHTYIHMRAREYLQDRMRTFKDNITPREVSNKCQCIGRTKCHPSFFS